MAETILHAKYIPIYVCPLHWHFSGCRALYSTLAYLSVHSRTCLLFYNILIFFTLISNKTDVPETILHAPEQGLGYYRRATQRAWSPRLTVKRKTKPPYLMEYCFEFLHASTLARVKATAELCTLLSLDSRIWEVKLRPRTVGRITLTWHFRLSYLLAAITNVLQILTLDQ